MNHLRTALLLLALTGCAAAHEVPDDPDHPDYEPVGGVDVVVPPIADPISLETCLDDGGALTLVASVDNDDVTEHGDINTLAVAGDGRIAVAASDGTIKLWTIEEGFLGQLVPSLQVGAQGALMRHKCGSPCPSCGIVPARRVARSGERASAQPLPEISGVPIPSQEGDLAGAHDLSGRAVAAP